MSELVKTFRGPNFKCIITEKGDYCVLSFFGAIGANAAQCFRNCMQEIEKMSSKYFILDFKYVEDIARSFDRSLVQLKLHVVNDRKGLIKFCNIKPKLKHDLFSIGTIKSDEISETPKDALHSIMKEVSE